MLRRITGVTGLTIASAVFAAAGDPSFEGTVSATLTRPGTEPAHFVFTRKNNQLRIENTSNKLEPVNILDLQAKRLTIVYPHNTTFVNVDLTKKQQQPNGPGLPPGMPPGFPPTGPMPQGMQQPGPAIGIQPSPQIGPNLSNLPSPPPGFPSPPPMPSMPESPLGKMPAFPNPSATGPPMPAGTGAGVGPRTGIPGMPPIPPMPGMFGSGDLKKTDKTKKIQGFDCTLYTISSRGENFEIWATNDSTLFPFQLIIRDYIGRRFGPQMLEETWPELLHNKGLFPLEATLKMDPGGQERLSFKVDKIESPSRTGTKIDDAKLFQPPEKYIEIEGPQL